MRLRTKGPDTVAHETNLARAPVWNARTPVAPDQLVTISVLYGQPFQQKGGQPLTAADQRWFAELTNRWVREGCSADLRVAFSLREAAEILGYKGGGGRQLQLISSSLVRLRSATFVSALRRPDGTEKRTTWGLIDLAQAIEPRSGPGRGWAELNRHMAALLQEGSVTYLHAPLVWDSLDRKGQHSSPGFLRSPCSRPARSVRAAYRPAFLSDTATSSGGRRGLPPTSQEVSEETALQSRGWAPLPRDRALEWRRRCCCARGPRSVPDAAWPPRRLGSVDRKGWYERSPGRRA